VPRFGSSSHRPEFNVTAVFGGERSIMSAVASSGYLVALSKIGKAVISVGAAAAGADPATQATINGTGTIDTISTTQCPRPVCALSMPDVMSAPL
jgi:hypothetical protein